MPAYPAALFMSFIMGGAMILLTASINTLVQSAIEDRFRGRVMSLYVTIFLGPLPFGSLLAGRLAEAVGVVSTMQLGAAASLALSILLMARTPEFVRFGV
jgi:MFS family permease